ncbi:senescence-associated protein [Plasmodium falciparum IGH-CR14]|uniref:Senescence-associated protein n=2 Tax=Plasmodium falciparum TaxID=5833 RepID=A0A0L0CSQ7_PLAFA|nr:senescence-associated protein [Plasmodium falciparum RAJ116]KNC36103.1 senescence-associated protein [Plasmodium falciparum RAJ116]KNG77550.1 senescence-associated protein [Plasmodium falciparum IGH-CR14]
MIGRADIEGSKSYVAKSAWQPQASYPCGNFSDTFICTVRMLLIHFAKIKDR